ncbi:MAG: helix-turn-helix transcriptional regulator [Clostridia bacterium]|nr:helix-turn-helix transcriptional regulator [Clostridia bacterium]
MKTETIPILEQLNNVQPYILSGELAQLDPSWSLNLGSAPYSRLYYFIKGEAWIESGNVRTVMKAGCFYFVPAGLPFRTGCKNYAEKYYFHLNLLKRDGYDLSMELDRVVGFPVSEERLDRLQSLVRERSLRSALLLKNLLMEDVLTAFEQEEIGGDVASAYSLPVQKTVKYIRKNLSSQLSVRALAERLYLSERTLNNLFHRELGKTVGQYIDEMLLFEAQRRLLLTDQAVGEISEALGYCDQFYFSRRFKEHCGKTPSAYRREGKN